LELVGVHWNSLEFIGTRWSSLELVGVHWNSLEFIGTSEERGPRSSSEELRRDQEPGVCSGAVVRRFIWFKEFMEFRGYLSSVGSENFQKASGLPKGYSVGFFLYLSSFKLSAAVSRPYQQ
jgi:hypothetical protein